MTTVSFESKLAINLSLIYVMLTIQPFDTTSVIIFIIIIITVIFLIPEYSIPEGRKLNKV